MKIAIFSSALINKKFKIKKGKERKQLTIKQTSEKEALNRERLFPRYKSDLILSTFY